jgi:hypothetical protein
MSTVISQIQYIRTFAQNSKVMKRMCFISEEAFLEKLDEKVYAVCDKQGRYLCDVVEEDYLRLIDAGILVNLDENRDYTLMEADGNDILTIDLGEKGRNDFKERFGLSIEIKGEYDKIRFKEFSLDYEIDNLILRSSKGESETSFVFMDGIAIQIESLESLVPAKSPIILIYPHKQEVNNSVKMRDEIECYRGHSWDGDYYSIALLYGEEIRLQNIKKG